MKTIFIAISALMLSGASLLAQKSASVEISLFAFQYAKGYQKVFLNSKGADYQAVTLSSANILGPFKAVLSEERKVFLYEEKTTEDGTDDYSAIFGIKIPSSIKKPLLILVPRSENTPYGALILDRSMTNFPEGSYQLVNFSKHDIRAIVGKTRVTAPPKKITSFNPSSNSTDLLNVHFQYKLAENWRTFGRTRWVNERNKRSLLMAYLDPRTQRMKIKGIPLRPAPVIIDKKE